MAAGPLVGILAAAGTGERLGGRGPKAFVRCAGRPLAEWSLAQLLAVCDRVVMAIPPGAEEWLPDAAAVQSVVGGPSRSESVRAAAAAAPDADTFVVHDAARPLVTRALIERCVEELARGWDGAVAAAPIADTVKEAAPDRRVVKTLDRSVLWAAQTPQAFRAPALRRALALERERLAAATDDASLVEATGGRVVLVEAPPGNIKVTRAADLSTAEALLRERAGEPARG